MTVTRAYVLGISTQRFTSESYFSSTVFLCSFLVFSSLHPVLTPAFATACKKAYTDHVREKAFPSHLEAILSCVNPDGSLTIPDSPSCRTLPSPLSELEAKFYYTGLYSAPPLVARTGTTPWEVPTSPETYQKLQELRAAVDHSDDIDWKANVVSKRDALMDSIRLKELRPAGSHQLGKVWGDNLGPKVFTLLDSMEVKWTSIDIVRIGYGEEYYAPAVVWIGVTPGSLSGDDGAAVVSECHKLLVEHDITDVDVEIRESIVW